MSLTTSPAYCYGSGIKFKKILHIANKLSYSDHSVFCLLVHAGWLHMAKQNRSALDELIKSIIRRLLQNYCFESERKNMYPELP